MPSLPRNRCSSSHPLPAPQVAEGPFLKKTLFNWGYSRKLHMLAKGYAHDKVGRWWIEQTCLWVVVRWASGMACVGATRMTRWAGA